MHAERMEEGIIIIIIIIITIFVGVVSPVSEIKLAYGS